MLKKIIVFSFSILLCSFLFSKIYTVDELLKLVEAKAHYNYVERNITPLSSFSVSSKINVFPFDSIEQTRNWDFRLTFFDSLSFFSSVDYESKKLYLENGIEWSFINERDSKEVLKAVISRKIELVNAYFDLIKLRVNINRLKNSIDQTDNMWNTTLPIEYGLSRIQENYLLDKIKWICGAEDVEVSELNPNISSLDLNLSSILNAVVYLNSPERKPPELSVVFSVSHHDITQPRLNAGFNFTWENTTEPKNEESIESLLETKKLFSQFEYLKDMLESYNKNLSNLQKGSPEYQNVRKIIEDYTIEVYRLYYQLKILEEISK